jgi:hypothetical protein
MIVLTSRCHRPWLAIIKSGTSSLSGKINNIKLRKTMSNLPNSTYLLSAGLEGNQKKRA